MSMVQLGNERCASVCHDLVVHQRKIELNLVKTSAMICAGRAVDLPVQKTAQFDIWQIQFPFVIMGVEVQKRQINLISRP